VRRRAGRIAARLLSRLSRRAPAPDASPPPFSAPPGMGPLEAYYAFGGSPCLLDVTLSDCRWYGASGLAYARSSLHPYVQTLVALDEGGADTYDGSFLERYWQAWQPENQAAYLGLDLARSHPLLLQTPANHEVLPWSPADAMTFMERQGWLDRSHWRELVAAGCPPARSCGPKPHAFGVDRFRHLVSIHESIRRSGFRPDGLAASGDPDPIVATCLVRGNDVRFLVADGQHRCAALAAMGVAEAPMLLWSLHGRRPPVVRREEAHSWPLVKLGIFAIEEASAVFDRVFEGTPPPALADSPLLAAWRR
jgi:hypothetical protein